MKGNSLLERLRASNKDNQRIVSINIGTLKAARSEILAHVLVNGKGVMTDIVLNQLNCAIDRAAMLQGQPVSNRDELLPSIKPAPELDSVAKNADSLPGNSPVIGWLRSDYNSDDKRDPNAPLFMLGSNDPSEVWGVKYLPLSCNSPVIGVDLASGPDRTVEVRYFAPPGYVMVPVEPTMAMLDEFDSIIDHGAEDSKDAWSRLIAAAPQQQNAPQNIPEIIPGWIPVSERVPESNGVYFGWDGKRVLEVNCFFGGFSANQFIHGEITHWMPLPAAPQQEVK